MLSRVKSKKERKKRLIVRIQSFSFLSESRSLKLIDKEDKRKMERLVVAGGCNRQKRVRDRLSNGNPTGNHFPSLVDKSHPL